MSESAIRTAIYNAVNGVSNVGVVHDYERWANDWGAFLDLFKTTISSTAQIRGFEVGYRGFQPDEPREFAGIHLRRHQFIVNGYLGLDDSAATEKTMATLVETVANALEDNAALAALAFYDVECSLLYETRMFGGVLCHYAQVSLEVAEVIT